MRDVICACSAADARHTLATATIITATFQRTKDSGQLFQQRLPTRPGFVSSVPVCLICVGFFTFAHKSVPRAAVNYWLVFFVRTAHQLLRRRDGHMYALVSSGIKCVKRTSNVCHLCLLIRRRPIERVSRL